MFNLVQLLLCGLFNRFVGDFQPNFQFISAIYSLLKFYLDVLKSTISICKLLCGVGEIDWYLWESPCMFSLLYWVHKILLGGVQKILNAHKSILCFTHVLTEIEPLNDLGYCFDNRILTSFCSDCLILSLPPGKWEREKCCSLYWNSDNSWRNCWIQLNPPILCSCACEEVEARARKRLDCGTQISFSLMCTHNETTGTIILICQ